MSEKSQAQLDEDVKRVLDIYYATQNIYAPPVYVEKAEQVIAHQSSGLHREVAAYHLRSNN